MPMTSEYLNSKYGFSCQTWLMKQIADDYFSNKYRIWFATCINPMANGSSSNPLIIYKELDEIVSRNDYNHSRINQLRSRLTNWIKGSYLNPRLKQQIISEILSAPVTAFRPQLWRINLENIQINRIINIGQFPNEYLLVDAEFPEVEVLTL
jgi:hypothetical protein